MCPSCLRMSPSEYLGLMLAKHISEKGRDDRPRDESCLFGGIRHCEERKPGEKTVSGLAFLCLVAGIQKGSVNTTAYSM